MSASQAKDTKLKQRIEKKTKDTGKEPKTDIEKEDREKVIDNLLERTKTLMEDGSSTKVTQFFVYLLLFIHNSQ